MDHTMRDKSGARWRAGAVAAVVVLGIGLAGCGSAKSNVGAGTSSVPVAAPGNGPVDVSVANRFWTTIFSLDPLATTTPGKEKATALGQIVCSSIKPSMTSKEAQQAAKDVLDLANIRPQVTASWAGVSVAAFCPQYTKLITG